MEDAEGNEDMDMEDEDEDDDEEYGDEYDGMGKTGFTQGTGAGVNELPHKRRKKKKKKKKKKKPAEYEDPSLREHLLAGAYGGVAKPKLKRPGVKYTTDINAGLRDIATPASAFIRDPSKKMLTSFSGFREIAGNADSSKERRRGGEGNRTNRLRSSAGKSDMGSNIGSKIGRNNRNFNESHTKLMDP